MLKSGFSTLQNNNSVDSAVLAVRASDSLDYSAKNNIINALGKLSSKQQEDLMRLITGVSSAVVVSKIISYLFGLGKIPSALLGIGAGFLASNMVKSPRNAVKNRYLSGENSFGVKY